MAKLDRIANVQISLRTTAITERSFSDMLILGSHVLAPNRVMVITGADELLDLGLSSTDPLYFAARDAFSQIPAVRQVYIGRRQVDAVPVNVGTVVEGQDYDVTLRWYDGNNDVQTITATYTAIADDEAADVATGLATAINATTAPVTAAGLLGVVTITSDVAGAGIGLALAGNLTVGTLASTETVTDALAAVNGEMSNWYGLILTSRVEADVKAAMAWAETNEKLFDTATSDLGVLDAVSDDDIGAYAMQNQYFHTNVRYSAAAATSYPDAAIMSSMFTFYPGQETWALKKLAGIPYDNITEGQFIAATAKNVSTFELFRNFAVTQGGRTAAGEWTDVIRLRDALVDQIKVSVVSSMINADGKVPYTDDGIQIIGNAIRGPLDLNVRRGGIAPPELDDQNRLIPSYTLQLPRSFEVPFNDKANRILRDVKFTARLAGAIHVVEVRGSLSYAL